MSPCQERSPSLGNFIAKYIVTTMKTFKTQRLCSVTRTKPRYCRIYIVDEQLTALSISQDYIKTEDIPIYTLDSIRIMDV